VFEDFLLFEKMAHFNRERVPERVVHAQGFGRLRKLLTVTNTGHAEVHDGRSCSEKVGKQTPMFLRFSDVGGGRRVRRTPSAIPAGFAMKFYTEEGNWDLVGNNKRRCSSFAILSSSRTLSIRRSATRRRT